MRTLDIGSLSHGTIWPEEAADALLSALHWATRDDAEARAKLQRLVSPWTYCEDTDDEGETVPVVAPCGDGWRVARVELASELLDALIAYAEYNDFVPLYCYLGSHEGDGGDFGVWVDHDSLSRDVLENYLASVEDLAELDDIGPEIGAAVHVNDHGNTSLYVRSEDGWTEAWGIV